MKNLVRALFVFALLLCFLPSQAQDVIKKKSGQKVKCTVIEMGKTEVKYIQWGDPNEVIFSIDRALIEQIKFSYGSVHREEPPEGEEFYFVDDRANAIKLDFIAIGNNALILTYERALNPFSSVEGSVKILGVGRDRGIWDRDGFGIDAAYKIKFGSIFNSTGYRPRHIMQGGFLRAALGVSTAKENEGTFFGSRPIEYTQVHLGLSVGKQWALQNAAVVELYLGLHYYGGSFSYVGSSDIPNFEEFNDGNLYGFDGSAISFGFRVGGLFSKYKPKELGTERSLR